MHGPSLPFQGRWLGAAETERSLQICDNLSVSLRLTAPLQGEPWMVRSVGAGLCSASCSDEIGPRGRSRAPPLHGENPLPRSAGKGVLFGGYSFSSSIISSVTMDSGVLRVSKSR